MGTGACAVTTAEADVLEGATLEVGIPETAALALEEAAPEGAASAEPG